MARTLQQKLRLAVTDPGRIGPFLYYRSLNLLWRALGREMQPKRLDARLIQALDRQGNGLAASLDNEAARIERAVAERATLQPLKLDERTYNPAHPDYHPKLRATSLGASRPQAAMRQPRFSSDPPHGALGVGRRQTLGRRAVICWPKSCRCRTPSRSSSGAALSRITWVNCAAPTVRSTSPVGSIWQRR